MPEVSKQRLQWQDPDSAILVAVLGPNTPTNLLHRTVARIIKRRGGIILNSLEEGWVKTVVK